MGGGRPCAAREAAARSFGVGRTSSVVVTGAPFYWRGFLQSSLFGPGEDRGDGPWRSPFEGSHDTAAPGPCQASDRQQRDAPQSASQ